jgi:hypothetical protein
MTIIDEMEKQYANSEARVAHLARLTAGLSPDPQEWIDTGVVIDAGPGATLSQNPPRCVCGHPIRYQCEIQRPSKEFPGQFVKEHLGNVCIDYLSELNPALAESLKKHLDEFLARIEAKKKQAKEAQQDEQIKVLAEQYKSIFEAKETAYINLRNQGKRANYALWCAFGSRSHGLRENAPTYTRKASYITWYKKQIARVTALSELAE